MEKLSLFWLWFRENEKHISDAWEEEDYDWLDSHFSEKVRELDENIGWEIGPYNAPKKTFVLSPIILENLAFTKNAISLAPELEDWIFLPSKPRKALKNLNFTRGHTEVDGSNWLYRLTSFNEGEFVDIEIFIREKESPPENEISHFSELIVESLVGEELRLERIGNIKTEVIPNAMNEEKLDHYTPIKHLYDHLQQVLT